MTEIAYTFDPSQRSYIALSLSQLGGDLTVGGYFYWEKYQSIVLAQLFYFADNSYENYISIYYNKETSVMHLNFQYDSGSKESFEYNLGIEYSIYVHYIFQFNATDHTIKFFKNFKEVKEKNGKISKGDIKQTERSFAYIGRPDPKSVNQYYGGRIEQPLVYNGVFSPQQLECIISKNSCNENESYVKANNCKTCNNEDKKCTSCYASRNFELTNKGTCACQLGYTLTDGVCQVNSNVLPGVDQETLSSASQGTKGIITTMIVSNPTVAISLVDTLQMIKYTVYLDYEFPNLIYVYFDIFSGMVDFNFMPGLSAINQNYQDPPEGFKKFDETGFLFDNINSYIWLTLICGISWYTMGKINQKINYRDQKHQKLKQIFRKVLQKFEYDIFFTGLVQSQLFCNIFCFVTITSLDISTILQGIAYIFALMIICIELGCIFLIYQLSKVYLVNTKVHGDPDIDEKDLDQVQDMIVDKKKQSGLYNEDADYDEEDENQLQSSKLEQAKDKSDSNEEKKQDSEYPQKDPASQSAIAISGQEANQIQLESEQKQEAIQVEEPEQEKKKTEKLSILTLGFYQKNQVFDNPYLFYQFFKQTEFLFEEVKHENLWQLNYQTICCIRKFIYAGTLVFLNQKIILAYIIWIVSSLAMAVYFIKVKPQEFKRNMIHETSQEFYFIGIYLCCIMFKMLVPEGYGVEDDVDATELASNGETNAQKYQSQVNLICYIMMGLATIVLIQDIVLSFWDTGYTIYESTYLRLKFYQKQSQKARKKKMNANYIYNELDELKKIEKEKQMQIKQQLDQESDDFQQQFDFNKNKAKRHTRKQLQKPKTKIPNNASQANLQGRKKSNFK